MLKGVTERHFRKPLNPPKIPESWEARSSPILLEIITSFAPKEWKEHTIQVLEIGVCILALSFTPCVISRHCPLPLFPCKIES